MSELPKISDWLRNEATKRSTQAAGRRASACTRNATAAELRSAKRLAEKMTGHKLHGVSTDPESNNQYCDMQDRIADKLEAEAKQLTEWADLLVNLADK